MPGDYADRCCVPDGDACADAGRGWRHLSLGMKIELSRTGGPPLSGAGSASRTFRVSAEVLVAEPRVDSATRRVKGPHRIPVIHQTGQRMTGSLSGAPASQRGEGRRAVP